MTQQRGIRSGTVQPIVVASRSEPSRSLGVCISYLLLAQETINRFDIYASLCVAPAGEGFARKAPDGKEHLVLYKIANRSSRS